MGDSIDNFISILEIVIKFYAKLSGATHHVYFNGYIHYYLFQNGIDTTHGYIYLRVGRLFFWE